MPTTTKYIWDDDNYLAEADGNDTINVVYTNEPQQYGNLVSTRIASTTSYHHFDASGSTRQLTNAAGHVTDSMTYDAWGTVVNRAGSTLAFQLWIGVVGYYFDRETDLVYIRVRTYRAALARWTSLDLRIVDVADLPISGPLLAIASKMNPELLILLLSGYLYVHNQPIDFADPSGNIPAPTFPPIGPLEPPKGPLPGGLLFPHPPAPLPTPPVLGVGAYICRPFGIAVANRNFVPNCDGCSRPPGKPGDIFVNKIGGDMNCPKGGANFKAVCDAHDRCYQTCNMPKRACDEHFLYDLESACYEAARTGEGRCEGFTLDNCLRTAKAYSEAVAVGAASAYVDDQMNACICIEPSEIHPTDAFA